MASNKGSNNHIKFAHFVHPRLANSRGLCEALASKTLIKARVMEEAKKQLEESAQRIADLLPGHLKANKASLSVKFPHGAIRTLKEVKPRWPYLTGERARIVACTIQLCDKNWWHLNTWEVGLTCGTMWVWHCTIPVIAVIETLMYEYGVQTGIVKELLRPLFGMSCTSLEGFEMAFTCICRMRFRCTTENLNATMTR